MYQKVTDYLKSYVTIQDIPLTQILTPSDIHHISATVSVLGKSKSEIQFEDVHNRIFEPLGGKGEKILDYGILHSIFDIKKAETPEVTIMELAFYCLMYLKSRHDLPIERVLELVTSYIKQMIIPATEIKYSSNPDYPNSNLISISDTEYVRTNGLELVPPTKELRQDFINKIKQLLIP